MKNSRIILSLGLLLNIATDVFAQGIATKEKFVESFIHVFTARANAFDTILKKNPNSIKDPYFELDGATVCYIDGENYVANYYFKDSMQAMAGLNQLKILLNEAASKFSATAKFIAPTDYAGYLQYFLSDEKMYLASFDNLLYLEPVSKKKAPPGYNFLVCLQLNAAPWENYYTAVGNRVEDPAFNQLLRSIVLSKDSSMTNFKAKKIKTTTEGATFYASNQTIPGFKAEIVESKSYGDFIDNTFRLTNTIIGKEAALFKRVDSLILKFKSALPDYYVYQLHPTEQVIYFFENAFTSVDNKTKIELHYGVQAGKKNAFDIILEFTKSYKIPTNENSHQVYLNEFTGEAGKKGFKNTSGKIIIPAIYDKVASFNEGRAMVSKNNLFGYVDEKGNEIVPIQYQDVDLWFYHGVALVKKYNQWGLVDSNGNTLVSPQYDEISPSNLFREHVKWLTVQKKDKYGLIDERGKLILPLNYEAIENYADSFFYVRQNGKVSLLDRQLKTLLPFTYEHIDYETFIQKNKASVKLNGKWGYIDNNGREILAVKYDNLYGFSEGLFAVELDHKVGFVDLKGNVVIPLQYERAQAFSEGLAAVRKNGKFGFIDKTGKKIIDFNYSFVYSFSQGLAAIEKNNKWGYIDRKGNLVIPCIYDNAKYFETNGKAKVYLGHKWGLINKKGAVVEPINNEEEEEEEW